MLNERYWPSKVLNALACWSSNSELKSDITLGTSLPRDLEYVVNLKKITKRKMQNNIIDIMIKHMYNYPRIMKRQFKTRINQNSCIEIFNFQNQNLRVSIMVKLNWKNVNFIYILKYNGKKKRSDGLSLKCKIIFRLSTCLLNSPSLNVSSPRLVYSRRNSGKCTGPRWRSPGSEPYPPAWRIQDTYNNIQITPIGQNRLIL